MRKDEMIAAIAIATDLPKLQIQRVFAAYKDLVLARAREGEPVVLPALGRFATRDLKARTTRNPRTGIEVRVPEKRKIRFKPSKTVLDALNQG